MRGEISTQGLSLFLRVHECVDSVAAFDAMLDVAQALANELAGELKDETRSVMTLQTIEHSRLEIQQYQQKYR